MADARGFGLSGRVVTPQTAFLVLERIEGLYSIQYCAACRTEGQMRRK